MFEWLWSWISYFLFGNKQEQEQTQPEKALETKPEENKNQTQANTAAPKQPAKPAIDKSMFIQRNKTDEVIRRESGQINGNQFVGADLTRCKVIVTDFCDSMMFDRCTDCEFILSAVRGSIFARTCTNCKFVVVTGQFRCRDCNNCDFFMHVKTGPVVESSHQIRIGCAEVSYPELYEHMEKARIPTLQNLWIDVYNFTPQDGDFTYESGAKLHLDLQNNEESLLPFTYQKDSSKTYFTFDSTSFDKQALIKLTHQESVKVHKIVEKDNNAIEVYAEANSQEEIEKAFASISPVNIKKLE